MDIATLEGFLTLARIGHMTRAAQQLHITQPALSARIAKLEDHVGYRLFDRTPKGMILTRAGELYREHVDGALGRLRDGQRALGELAGLVRGELALGGGATATNYLLPPLLGRYHAIHPEIRLYVREQGSQSVVEGVLAGELDLGVVTLPLERRKGLEVEEWIEDELVLIVPRGHRLEGRGTFAWEELEGEGLVLFEAGSAVRELLERRLNEASVRTHTVMELRSIESIKQMVAQGIGAAFVSRYALESAEQGIVPERDPVRRMLGIVTHSDRTTSEAARAFVETMRAGGSRLGGRLSCPVERVLLDRQ